MGLQLAMMKSQISLNEANANKANTEANVTGGVGADLIKQNIENLKISGEKLLAETDESKSRTAINEFDASLKDLEVKFASETLDKRVEMVNIGVEKAHAELAITLNDKKISDETLGNRIEQIATNLIYSKLQIELIELQKNKTKEEIELLKNQAWKISQDVALVS